MFNIRSVITPALCVAASLGVSLGLKLTPEAKIDAALNDTQAAVHLTLDRLEANVVTDCILGVDLQLETLDQGCPPAPGENGGKPAVSVDVEAEVGAKPGNGGDGCPCPEEDSAALIGTDVNLSIGIGDGGGCGDRCGGAPNLVEANADLSADLDGDGGGCGEGCGGLPGETAAEVSANTDINVAADTGGGDVSADSQLDVDVQADAPVEANASLSATGNADGSLDIGPGNGTGDCGCLLNP